MSVARRKIHIISAVIAVGITLIIALAVILSSCNHQIRFNATFYYVCCEYRDDALSASSVSSSAQALGGAGYVVSDGGKYYATVACYYNETDARKVCAKLRANGYNYSVLNASRESFGLETSNARLNERKYLGNINTLYSLSVVFYTLANDIDARKIDRGGAKLILADARKTLSALLAENPENCFSQILTGLISGCDEISGDIYSRDARRLQVAVADSIINLKLY